jgi:hypothetical protein
MSAGSQIGKWRKADAGWLAAAIAVHALLLYLPLTRTHSELPQQIAVEVHLVPFVEEVESSPVMPQQTPEVAQEATEQRLPEVTQEDSIEPQTDLATPHVQTESEPEQTLPSSARLIASIASIQLHREQAEEHRQLGIHRRQSLPSNWVPGTGTGAAQTSDNMFDGMVLPNSVELVDQWVAADGSRNVVLNLPNGTSVCGRGTAWDPMRPMMEPLMMFRPCGSGGKRTFNMSAADARSSVR